MKKEEEKCPYCGFNKLTYDNWHIFCTVRHCPVCHYEWTIK